MERAGEIIQERKKTRDYDEWDRKLINRKKHTQKTGYKTGQEKKTSVTCTNCNAKNNFN